MICPNCSATMQTTHSQYLWCARCGCAEELTPSGHVRRIHITQQATPAERNSQREAIGSNGL